MDFQLRELEATRQYQERLSEAQQARRRAALEQLPRQRAAFPGRRAVVGAVGVVLVAASLVLGGQALAAADGGGASTEATTIGFAP